eukprot:s672_g9.t1
MAVAAERQRSLQRLPELCFQELRSATRGAAACQENCIICLSDFEDSSQVSQLACGHVFHANCIKIWLSGKKRLGIQGSKGLPRVPTVVMAHPWTLHEIGQIGRIAAAFQKGPRQHLPAVPHTLLVTTNKNLRCFSKLPLVSRSFPRVPSCTALVQST